MLRAFVCSFDCGAADDMATNSYPFWPVEAGFVRSQGY